MNQVTFFAAITDTTPGLVTELLTLTGGDPKAPRPAPPPPQAATPRQDSRVFLCRGKPTPYRLVVRPGTTEPP